MPRRQRGKMGVRRWATAKLIRLLRRHRQYQYMHTSPTVSRVVFHITRGANCTPAQAHGEATFSATPNVSHIGEHFFARAYLAASLSLISQQLFDFTSSRQVADFATRLAISRHAHNATDIIEEREEPACHAHRRAFFAAITYYLLSP